MSIKPKAFAQELFVEPWKRLKYGFLPVKRIVDENLPTTGSVPLEPKGETKEEEIEESEIEYRDEATCLWWNYFNEGEYRKNRKVGKKNPWYSWFNGSTSAQEKKLILKLDILLTFYSCMAYWVKYLDPVNSNNILE